VYSKQVFLHKDIADDDLRVLKQFRSICILDKNDFLDASYLYTVQNTRIADDLFSYRDLAVYPYLKYVEYKDMEEEQFAIRRNNMFIQDGRKAKFIVNVEARGGAEYWIHYNVHKEVIQNVAECKREIKKQPFLELLCRQQKQDLLKANGQKLQQLLSPPPTYELTSTEHATLPGILKEDVMLYKYQLNDVDWMNTIRNNVITKQNIIEHSFPVMASVLNDDFVLLNNNVFPAWLMKNKNVTENLTVSYNGGNLVSQVGLGKTLITLYYIFQASERQEHYNQYVEFVNKCNYTFKRGHKRGQDCVVTVKPGEMYCNHHKSTMFMDKRVLQYKNLDSFKLEEFMRNGRLQTNASLIVCPNHLCDQWVREYYDKFVNDKRIVLIITRDQYKNLKLADILFADVVIVSYQFLLNSFYQQDRSTVRLHHVKSPIDLMAENGCLYEQAVQEVLDSRGVSVLHLFNWNNIFLDESHEMYQIGRKGTLTATLAELHSTCKWNITGTPLANGLDGFLNLITFNTSFQKGGMAYTSMNVFELMKSGVDSKFIEKFTPLFRCNTKESTKSECTESIINETVHRLEFTPQERNIYDSHLQGVKSKYSNFLIQLCCHSELYASTKVLIKNCKTLDEVQQVMLDFNNKQLLQAKQEQNTIENDIQMLQDKLDCQCIGHTEYDDIKSQMAVEKRRLTAAKQTHDNIQRTFNYLENAIASLEADDTCPICLDKIDQLTITKCGHKFCWDCLAQTHDAQKNMMKNADIKCPSCNTLMSTKDVYLLASDTRVSSDIGDIVSRVRSTKIGNIIHYLKTSLVQGDKVIIFSQWDELLHKVGNFLQQFNINIVYCQGSVYNRKRAIHDFVKDDQSINIIMLSSRNAASGINLTVANKIILLEPVYGTCEYRNSIETQAIGRADRIGQKKPIDVHRFVIKDTIEEDIVNNNIDESKMKHMTMT
jgi:SNF2 family DNA or RNA helicase